MSVPQPDDGHLAHLRGGTTGEARLMQRYESLAQVSHEMLAAARHGDWASVAQLEDICRALIEELKRAALHERLSMVEQRHRIALLRSILADDAEIRDRSEPWLRQLEQMLHSSGAAPRRPSGG